MGKIALNSSLCVFRIFVGGCGRSFLCANDTPYIYIQHRLGHTSVFFVCECVKQHGGVLKLTFTHKVYGVA